jgi:hypothetical protein
MPSSLIFWFGTTRLPLAMMPSRLCVFLANVRKGVKHCGLRPSTGKRKLQEGTHQRLDTGARLALILNVLVTGKARNDYGVGETMGKGVGVNDWCHEKGERQDAAYFSPLPLSTKRSAALASRQLPAVIWLAVLAVALAGGFGLGDDHSTGAGDTGLALDCHGETMEAESG